MAGRRVFRELIGRSFVNQKLDKDKFKVLSLDPHRYQYRNRVGEEEEAEEEEDREDSFYRRNCLLYGSLEPPDSKPPPQLPKKRSYLPSSSSFGVSDEYARLGEKMGESSHQRGLPSSSPVRLGVRNTGGEIVEVQGGHIVRSIGRKDRHSKVCTAKGPRDRRVRLAAHTAIQFYDVQDRLGYDRPSKAVDWLIKKAKTAIDELEQLPPWKPTAAGSSFDDEVQKQQLQDVEPPEDQLPRGFQQNDLIAADISEPSSKRTMLTGDGEQQGIRRRGNANASLQNSSFLPPSLDSDSIADTIKSFFPICASTETNSSAIPFQSFPNPGLLSRTSSHSQDLKLSLQSFQDPISLHHHNQQNQNPTQAQIFLSGTPLTFDGATGWHENPAEGPELSRFQRLAAWNSGGESVGGTAAAAGYILNPPQPSLLSQQQFLSQRGPLQSSNTPWARAWMDPSAIAMITGDHNQQLHHQHPVISPIYPSSSMSGIGFTSGIGGFSGFHIPARIHGNEEEQIGYSDRPSSASSDSRH